MDLEKFQSILEAKRAELVELSALSSGARGTVTLDQQSVGRLSRMDAMQGQAMAQEAERRRHMDIQRIDAALARIAAGDFGYCVQCDEPIAEKRLEIDPAASVCINCAGKSKT
ncbi:MAG: TraR/DksA family transcriptional regulator [Fimbriimonadaceae bacterium]|nr:TraR/DksA family transcriptional regulator [Alphaproteobacteria bacterium]